MKCVNCESTEYNVYLFDMWDDRNENYVMTTKLNVCDDCYGAMNRNRHNFFGRDILDAIDNITFSLTFCKGGPQTGPRFPH